MDTVGDNDKGDAVTVCNNTKRRHGVFKIQQNSEFCQSDKQDSQTSCQQGGDSYMRNNMCFSRTSGDLDEQLIKPKNICANGVKLSESVGDIQLNIFLSDKPSGDDHRDCDMHCNEHNNNIIENCDMSKEKLTISPCKIPNTNSIESQDGDRKITPPRKISGSLKIKPDNGRAKMRLNKIVEAAAIILLPSRRYVQRAFNEMMGDQMPMSNTRLSSCKLTEKNVDLYEVCDESIYNSMVSIAEEFKGLPPESTLHLLGVHLVQLCLGIYRKEILCLSNDLTGIINTLNGFRDHVKAKLISKDIHITSLRCQLHEGSAAGFCKLYARCIFDSYILCGVIEEIAKEICNKRVKATINSKPDFSNQTEILLTCENDVLEDAIISPRTKGTFTIAHQIPIDVITFAQSFPFHVLINKRLEITRLGSSLARTITINNKQYPLLATYFDIVKPVIHTTFTAILLHITSPFELAWKGSISASKSVRKRNIYLKGQMIYLAESSTLLFIGSPKVSELNELIGDGLYMSDIPIYDVTRDVILVGEQNKAQDGLKKRMESLRKRVEEASKAVDTEREKNVELLNLIFPPEVARELWHGCQVKPRLVENVSLLFSDIVGFTAICSTASPMQVISILQCLYTEFNSLCGLIDVYKIETIGDAYCVASGLHKPSMCHAAQCAWMAIKMIEAASKNCDHSGKNIKLRIGLHSGTVLAGVVGKKMPRFCLFGSDVTIANKMESISEAGRINVSPVTYKFLEDFGGFAFTRRNKDCSPRHILNHGEGICYFLDSYQFADEISTDNDILLGLQNHGICSTSM